MAIVVAASALFGLSKGYPMHLRRARRGAIPLSSLFVSAGCDIRDTAGRRTFAYRAVFAATRRGLVEVRSHIDRYLRSRVHGGLPKLYRLESSGRLWKRKSA
ncbi:hypothetical protein D3H35_00390 [Cohnella faecalis]|uniref:Uncharacterized protein n=1 Tax=Cohnella faecalis TaxID=2315694 RepID=A0A398D016_9BACL|nr:hypothetical protein D3H35_00390 [Cohnella faecalis]